MTITPRFRSNATAPPAGAPPTPRDEVATPTSAAPTKYVNHHAKRAGRAGARNAYPVAAGPLTNGQKATVCILARAGWERMEGPAGKLPALVDWRHEEQLKAAGVASLTAADQAQFPALLAHFLDLAGESGRAFAVLLRPELRDQKVALFKLAQACETAGLPLAYPAAICRTQYKCPLAEASPRQIWRLVFTIKNRGAKAR